MITVYYSFIENGATSHALLSRASLLHSGRDFPLHTERGKKPYFTSPEAPHFSISHSDNVWICVMCDREIGCDVQLHKPYPRYRSVAGRFFHENEITRVLGSPDPEREFFDIWAKKEAIAKLTGRGIDGEFKKTDSSACDIFVRSITLPINIPHSSAVASFDHFSDNEIKIVQI